MLRLAAHPAHPASLRLDLPGQLLLAGKQAGFANIVGAFDQVELGFFAVCVKQGQRLTSART